MKFGVVLPTTGDVANTSAISDVARRAEDLGMDAVWVIDHIAIPRNFSSRSLYTPDGSYPSADPPWDALSVLAFVAARTERIRLGTAVLVLPYRHPIALAKSVATIDALSDGRVVLGVGAGWLEEEFEALGACTFHERGVLTDEHLIAMKVVWGPDPCSFKGRFFNFDAIHVSPKPVQRPHPPLLIGGTSDAALRRAATHGDGWLGIALLPHEVSERRRRLEAFALAAGRTLDRFEVCLSIGIQLTSDRDAGALVPPEHQRLAIVGTPDQVAARLREYEDAGVTSVAAYVGELGDLLPQGERIVSTLNTLMGAVVPALAVAE